MQLTLSAETERNLLYTQTVKINSDCSKIRIVISTQQFSLSAHFAYPLVLAFGMFASAVLCE